MILTKTSQRVFQNRVLRRISGADRNLHEASENCIVTSFMISWFAFLTKYTSI